MNLKSQNRNYLGWAFLLAWVFCVFYSGTIDGVSGFVEQQSDSIALRLLFSILPVASAVVALLGILGAQKRGSSPADNAYIVIGAPVATAVATPFLFIVLPSFEISVASYLIAAVVTGVGSAFMWVMWGQRYTRLSQEDIESSACASAVLAAVLSLVTLAAPTVVSIVMATAFPLISGALYALARGKETSDNAGSADAVPPAGVRSSDTSRTWGMKDAAFGITVACFFVSIEGSFWHSGSVDNVQVVIIFALSAVYMLMVGVSAMAGPRRISLEFAYRWMCPIMVVGFAALIIAPSAEGAFVAAAVSIAARFAFCLMTQMYFAVYALRGAASPVQAFAWGWIFVHAGDMLGVLVSTFIDSQLQAGVFDIVQVSAVLCVLLVAATMVALGNTHGFWAWEQNLEEEPVAYEGTSEAPKAGEDSDAHQADENAKGPESSETGASQEPQVASAVSAANSLECRVAELSKEFKLTPRETEIFALLAQGRSIPYIRDELFISRDTAATHAKHIYQKLDVHSRQELIDLVAN